MTSFPNSPRLLKGGIVLLDPQTLQIPRVIVLQSSASPAVPSVPDAPIRLSELENPPRLEAAVVPSVYGAIVR